MKGSKNPATCTFNNCAKKAALWYMDKGLCFNHWNIIAQMPEDQRKRKLGIPLQKEVS